MKMNFNTQLSIATLAAALFITVNAAAQSREWPQFLGPDGNGKSTETGILRNWPDGGPEVLWNIEVGRGYGGPVISGGRAYILDRDDTVGDVMRCLDMSTGREVWRYAYDSPGELPFPGSRSVPVVEGGRVYSVGPNGDLLAIDTANGQPVWRKNVWTDFGGGELPTWGISQCPVVYGDLLLVAAQTADTGVVAYNT